MVGYSCGNIFEIDPIFHCPMCALLLREPIQLFCGHRYCGTCINQEQTLVKCTQCSQETANSNMFVDRGMKNDMEKLKINCSICGWIGLFKHYPHHLTYKHRNTSVNPSTAVSQVQQLVQSFNELSKNVFVFQSISRIFLSEASTYKISVEEQSPPGESVHRQEDCFIPPVGTFLWKIDGVKSRFDGNSNAVTTSLPFYTSSNGYKMCARLSLNGNSCNASTHLLISLIVLRGDFDAILQWPMELQIIFCLCDIATHTNHLIKSFQSNKESASFQRPQTNMNIESSLSDFIPLSLIQQANSSYVYNDSMYIKVMIPTNFIPRPLLPRLVNMDPAWPLYIQEEMIQKEIAKYHAKKDYKLHLTLKLRYI